MLTERSGAAQARAGHRVRAALGGRRAASATSWLLIAALGAGGVPPPPALAALQARRLVAAAARRSPGPRARLGRRRLLGPRRALRGPGDRRDRPGAGLERRPDRRARGARARVLGQRLPSAPHAADGAAAPARAGRATLDDRRAPRARARGGAARGRPARGDDRGPAGARARRPARARRVTVNLGERRRTTTPSAGGRASRASRPRARGRRRTRTCCVRAARPATVGQVLDVLLDNALRHGRGPVRVDVVADGRVAASRWPTSGPGVAGGGRDRIFERGASHRGGTGIGLHLARALAQADTAAAAGCSTARRRASSYGCRGRPTDGPGGQSPRPRRARACSASFGHASDRAAGVGEQLVGDRAARRRSGSPSRRARSTRAAARRTAPWPSQAIGSTRRCAVHAAAPAARGGEHRPAAQPRTGRARGAAELGGEDARARCAGSAPRRRAGGRRRGPATSPLQRSQPASARRPARARPRAAASALGDRRQPVRRTGRTGPRSARPASRSTRATSATGHADGRQRDDDARAERRRRAPRRRASSSVTASASAPRDPGAVVAADEHRAQRLGRAAGASSTAPSGVPSAISCTPGRPTAPPTVTSAEPGMVRRSRAARNHAGPWRAISARCASVSGFCTSVGRRREAALERPRRRDGRLAAGRRRGPRSAPSPRRRGSASGTVGDA